MKKHIIGLTLFSLIVCTAAFIYAMFNVAAVEEVFVLTNTQEYPMVKSCWKMQRESNESSVRKLTVRQAVFDLKTKQLNWELAAPISSDDSKIALHFFVKNENGTRYVNSVLTPGLATSQNGVIKASGSYEWLDNLASYENLYVIPEYTSRDKYQKRQPKFDAGKAASVMLYSGEQGYLTEKYFNR